MPIYGSSMEPTLQSGGLLLISPVNPTEVKVGDIIVYNVPQLIREYYNYPPVVAHRVVKVTNERGILSFRTKGDNTGEDPFTIHPGDIRGTVGDQIPYAGLPLLFLQSQQGLIFVIISLVLLSLFLYSDELSLGQRKAHRGIFSPVIQESARSSRLLTQKIDTTEQRMEATEQALVKFASAIEQYAHHLASHTSAIQGLAEASHELKRGAAEQNKVLIRLMGVMEQPRTKPEPVEPPKPVVETTIKAEVKPEDKMAKLEQAMLALEKRKKAHAQYPPGCFKSRPTPAEEEVPEATRRL